MIPRYTGGIAQGWRKFERDEERSFCFRVVVCFAIHCTWSQAFELTGGLLALPPRLSGFADTHFILLFCVLVAVRPSVIF